MNSDEKEIRDVIDRWHRATPAGDLDTILTLMADDALFLRGGQRPMLEGRTPADLDALYRERQPYYARAHLTVDTAGLGVDQVVARILAALRGTHAARV